METIKQNEWSSREEEKKAIMDLITSTSDEEREKQLREELGKIAEEEANFSASELSESEHLTKDRKFELQKELRDRQREGMNYDKAKKWLINNTEWRRIHNEDKLWIEAELENVFGYRGSK